MFGYGSEQVALSLSLSLSLSSPSLSRSRSVMALFQRRRQSNDRRWLLLVPALSTVSLVVAVLLLLVALFSFLSLSPLDLDSHPSRQRFVGHRPLWRMRANASENQSGFVPKEGDDSKDDLWVSMLSKFYYGCSNSSSRFATEFNTVSNRYLMIATSGGLNQQRTGITDAVVAARILNATLVVPKLDQKSFWKDSSNFAEIFNVEWFVSALSKDVKIIKQLPEKLKKAVYTMRVPRKCTPRCYQNRVLPVLMKRHVVQLTKFDYRLANRLETDLQKLRCRVNYHALRFTDPIYEMGRKLIQRMRQKSRHFIALHLRFEPDMLAFSGCYYGGGEREKRELGAIRKRWKTLHTSNPDKERRHGKCPLTPEEVGLMLRALGFGSNTYIYVASGEVYRGEETLAALRNLFPNFHSKETLATKEELTPFASFSSRMAALDYIVCDESDVFVTNNNGNMAKMLAGRRRYFGHKRTIRPNARKLYSLFLNRANMSWEAFASRVHTSQRGFMGEPNEVRPGRGEFHENPSTCICEHMGAKEATKHRNNSNSKIINKNGKEDWSKGVGDVATDGDGGDDDDELPDWSDLDYGEDPATVSGGRESNGTMTDSDYGLFISRLDDPELEEILSD